MEMIFSEGVKVKFSNHDLVITLDTFFEEVGRKKIGLALIELNHSNSGDVWEEDEKQQAEVIKRLDSLNDKWSERARTSGLNLLPNATKQVAVRIAIEEFDEIMSILHELDVEHSTISDITF